MGFIPLRHSLSMLIYVACAPKIFDFFQNARTVGFVLMIFFTSYCTAERVRFTMKKFILLSIVLCGEGSYLQAMRGDDGTVTRVHLPNGYKPQFYQSGAVIPKSGRILYWDQASMPHAVLVYVFDSPIRNDLGGKAFIGSADEFEKCCIRKSSCWCYRVKYNLDAVSFELADGNCLAPIPQLYALQKITRAEYNNGLWRHYYSYYSGLNQQCHKRYK